MFPLAQQLHQACHAAKDCTSRLTGEGGTAMADAETSFAGHR
jgi:hypothetical protein